MSRSRRGSEAFPPQTDFQLCDNLIFFDKSMWRNRYTRTFEGRVEKSLGVQVPPSTIKKRVTKVTLFLICLNGEGFNRSIAGSADLRTDDTNEVS